MKPISPTQARDGRAGLMAERLIHAQIGSFASNFLSDVGYHDAPMVRRLPVWPPFTSSASSSGFRSSTGSWPGVSLSLSVLMVDDSFLSHGLAVEVCLLGMRTVGNALISPSRPYARELAYINT